MIHRWVVIQLALLQMSCLEAVKSSQQGPLTEVKEHPEVHQEIITTGFDESHTVVSGPQLDLPLCEQHTLCRIDRLLSPHFGRHQFLSDLRGLLHDHKPFVDSNVCSMFRRLIAGTTPEIRLLKERSSESDQIVLALKLSEVIRSLHSLQTPDTTAGKAVRFLSVRCGYKSLPGYLMGLCIMRDVTADGLHVLKKFVVPLLHPSTIRGSVVAIRDLLQHLGLSPGIRPEMWNILPKHLRSFLYSFQQHHSRLFYRPYRTCAPPIHDQLRGQYDQIRALYRVGFRLDLRAVSYWPDLKADELREMAPYLSAGGFGRYVATMLPRGQSDLVVELLRDPQLVLGLHWQLDLVTLFLSCQAAIRYGAPEVLRRLLSIPHAADALRRQMSAISLMVTREGIPSLSEDQRALLQVLGRNSERGKAPYVQDDGFHKYGLVLDLQTLSEALDEFPNLSSGPQPGSIANGLERLDIWHNKCRHHC